MHRGYPWLCGQLRVLPGGTQEIIYGSGNETRNSLCKADLPPLYHLSDRMTLSKGDNPNEIVTVKDITVKKNSQR